MNYLANIFKMGLRKLRPPMVTVIQGTVEWDVEKDSDTGVLIAECSSLKLVAWGHTQEQLKGRLERSVKLLFAHLAEHGALESFMKERGFSIKTYPIIASSAQVRVRVPPINGITNRLHPTLPPQYA